MTETLTRAAAPPAPDVGEAVPPPADGYLSGPGPWRGRDAVVAGVVAAVGLIGLVVCFRGAADELHWRDQLDWVTVAGLFTGLFVLAVTGWIVIGMRRLRRGFAVLARRQNAILGLDEVDPAEVTVDSTELVRVPPQGRVHRPTCLLLRGKSPVVVPADQAATVERCGVCRS